MDIDKIMELIDKVDNSGISSLTVEEGCLKISIEKNKGQVIDTEGNMQMISAMPSQSASIMPGNAPVLDSSNAVSGVYAQGAGAPAKGDAGMPVQERVSEATTDVFITSPIVGVFYTSSGPEEPPFAKVGDTVKKGQVVGIVEAMKLMNEIESDTDGVIEEILVENSQGVEYGQPLFKIK